MADLKLYKENDILKAIEDEGLVKEAWGYKTPNCIWIYIDGMEKDEVWDKFPTPLTGLEVGFWENDVLEPVKYFLLEGSKNVDSIKWHLNK